MATFALIRVQFASIRDCAFRDEPFCRSLSRLSRSGVLAATLALAGCQSRSHPLFESLDPGRTGVTFTNTLPEDTTFNILNYLYYYNGGGVAVGDIDNDGLPDLYFTSNLGAITDEEARTFDVPLSFLPGGQSWIAEIYADGPKANWVTNPHPVTISKRTVTSASTLHMVLAAGGGQAIRIRPAR